MGGCLAESSHPSGFGVLVPEVTVIDRNLIFCFPCPACGELIPLPAQSALGAIAAFQYYCARVWPIRFLCQRFSVVREVSESTIHMTTKKLISQVSNQRSLWQIDCECCLESCGKLHSIYTGYERDAPPDIVCGILINSNPTVACLGGHPAKFRREHLTAFRIAGA
jgi:hypothetical protein